MYHKVVPVASTLDAILKKMEKTISIAERPVHYWTYGDPAKPLLVMVHGLRGTHHGLRFIAEQLQDDFYIIIPDLPGFGESAPLEHHTLTTYVAWLREFLQQLAEERPVYLLGHSFGSIVASHTAAQYPQLINRLVLINPIVSAAAKDYSLATLATIGFYRLSAFLPRFAQRWFLSNRLIVDGMSIAMKTTKKKQLRQRVFSEHRAHFSSFASPTSVREAFAISIHETVARDLSCPILVIAGEKDQIARYQDVRAFVEACPTAKLVSIAGVGHLTHYETAPAAARAVRHFLAVQ